MVGSYCLLVDCRKSQLVKIGKLRKIKFKKGYYLYVGSALKSIEKRVCRHLRDSKKIFWHIDYLLAADRVKIDSVYYVENNKKLECAISEKIKVITIPVDGFGSSDCNCMSHLFYISEKSLYEVNKLLRQYNFNMVGAAVFLKSFCKL